MPVPANNASGSPSLSVSDIAKRVKRQFGDEAGAQIKDEDIIRWVNDAQRELALSNHLLQVTARTGSLVSQSEYGFPDNILELHSVKYKGVSLRGISLQEANELIPHHDDETNYPVGTPTHFWTWANTINLYPAPDVVGQNIILYYTRQPLIVTVVTDVPELPSAYHSRIVEYCLVQAYELDDNWEAAGIKAAQFQAGKTELRDRSEFNTHDIYPSITVSSADAGSYDDSAYGGWY